MKHDTAWLPVSSLITERRLFYYASLGCLFLPCGPVVVMRRYLPTGTNERKRPVYIDSLHISAPYCRDCEKNSITSTRWESRTDQHDTTRHRIREFWSDEIKHFISAYSKTRHITRRFLKRQHKPLYTSILKEPPPHPSVPDARKSLSHAAKKPVSHPHIAFSARQYRLFRTPIKPFQCTIKPFPYICTGYPASYNTMRELFTHRKKHHRRAQIRTFIWFLRYKRRDMS